MSSIRLAKAFPATLSLLCLCLPCPATISAAVKAADAADAQPAAVDDSNQEQKITAATSPEEQGTRAQKSEAAPVRNYLKEASPLGVTRWAKDRMPIKVFIASGERVRDFRPQFPEMVKASLNEWSAATTGGLSWKSAANESDADLIVEWYDDRAKLAELAPTVSDVDLGNTQIDANRPGASGKDEIDLAVVRIMTRARLSASSPGPQAMSDEQMQTVLLHELGHALGLQGHSSNRSDVMSFPSNWGKLSEADRETIRLLYSH